VISTSKPETFVRFVIEAVPNKTIDTLQAWLVPNDFTEFGKAIRSKGYNELRELWDFDPEFVNAELPNTQHFQNRFQKIQNFKFLLKQMKQNFDFDRANANELPEVLQITFEGCSPLILDGSKKKFRIVS
jgi:hypothetical protein